MIGRRAAQTRYQWLSCLATHGTQATQRAHRVRYLTLRRAEQSRFKPTALIWTRLHQVGQESIHRQARTGEAGTGGAGHQTHTNHRGGTRDPYGSRTPPPSSAPRAPCITCELRPTCKTKRHNQRGFSNRMRCMATQEAGHRVRGRLELGERVH